MNGSVLGAKEEARLAWLAASLTPGMGPTRTARMMQRLGGSARMFSASLTDLEGTGIPAQSAQFLADGRARKMAEEEAERTAEQQAVFLTPEDEAYPSGCCRFMIRLRCCGFGGMWNSCRSRG